ncbi:glycoside hydrolase [Schizophyllum commune Tattone D]|nr:glycoside hydrolase [Schizophyllum commune Tattone D]
MHSPYRDDPRGSTHTELQDYYENVPPAHRFRGESPYASAANLNPSSQDIPLTQQGYTPPLAADTPAGRSYMHNIDREWEDGDATKASPWAAGAREKPNKSRRCWVLAGVALLIAGAVAGIVAGVLVSRNNSSSSKSNLASNSPSSGDPSDFDKDENLHVSFYGIAYTPAGSQLDANCGNSLDDVIKDVQLLSQITTRVRLYGADCNQSALVLEAVQQTKVNLTVWLGNYVSATDGGEAYERQRDTIKEVIQTYGTDHIGGITVGNEFMLNYVESQGTDDVTGTVGTTGAEMLITNITDTRSMLSDISVDLPVGTADAGAYFNEKLLSSVDYGMANVHPWFGDVSIDDAATWTWQFFQTNDVSISDEVDNKPQMYIAETGWPTKSSNTSTETNGASEASEANLQVFLDTFVCQANANGTEYFFFEFFDEEWKDKTYGGVEGWWGLFNSDRTLKNVTIPVCS